MSSYFTNTTAVGYNALGTASNQVRIGNSYVTSIGGQVGWTIFSDGRFKKEIREDVNGLDFILQLRPITYHVDVEGIDRSLKSVTGTQNPTDSKQPNQTKARIRHSGFVAQEVEATAKKLGYDFSGVDAPKNENDFYGLRYDEFVVPLVKAVQEQQQQIQKQNELNQQLTQLVLQLQHEVEKLKRKVGQ
jgi:hypothetical protein